MEEAVELVPPGDGTVLDLVDHLLNTGVVLVGDLAINVADIDLIYLRVQLMLSSAETARQAGWLASAPSVVEVPHGERNRALRAVS